VTTLVPFTPSNLANFTFQPVLDGTTYSAVVTWNQYGQRYYLNISTLQGVLMLSIPLIASPDAISQTAIPNGTQTLALTTRNPAIIAGMTVTGANVPAGTTITGIYGQLVTTSEAIPELSNTSAPQSSFEFTSSINLALGYFDTPIIFRGSTQQFEIG
jgi:hypothetical protein